MNCYYHFWFVGRKVLGVDIVETGELVVVTHVVIIITETTIVVSAAILVPVEEVVEEVRVVEGADEQHHPLKTILIRN